MRVVKKIEVVSTSDKSWEDAAEHAIQEVSKTVRNIEAIEIKQFHASVRDNKIVDYKISASIAFAVEGE